MRNRGTETEDSIKRRLDKAIEELRFGEIEGIFDLTITNDNFEEAYELLRNFIVEVRYNSDRSIDQLIDNLKRQQN